MSGAGNGIRTHDLIITSDVLYRLSYSSISSIMLTYYNINSPFRQSLILEIFFFFYPLLCIALLLARSLSRPVLLSAFRFSSLFQSVEILKTPGELLWEFAVVKFPRLWYYNSIIFLCGIHTNEKG